MNDWGNGETLGGVDEYEDLAFSIIKRAIVDYRGYYRRLIRKATLNVYRGDGKYISSAKELLEIELFLRTDPMVTSITEKGGEILERVRKEELEAIKDKRRLANAQKVEEMIGSFKEKEM